MASKILIFLNTNYLKYHVMENLHRMLHKL